MLQQLHDAGLRADHCYLAGFVSIGIAFASWLLSKNLGSAEGDRWGIFVGEWAPTFIALGNGLRTYEMQTYEK